MIEKKISERYARALFSLAGEQKQLDKVYDDLLNIKSVIDSSRDLQLMLSSPVIKYDKKINVFKEIFGDRISKLTNEFLVLTIKKHREMIIVSIVSQFEIIYNIANNRIPTLVTTAVELDEAGCDLVTKKISEITKKESLTEFKTDSSVKGGVKVMIDDWVFDATLDNKLKRIHYALVHGSL